MGPTRWRAAVAAVAALAVLGGCAPPVGGNGRYSSGLSKVPDATVVLHGGDGGPIDKLAGNAIADIQAYWTQQMPPVFGKPYQPVSGFYSIDPNGNQPAPCTNTTADIRGNAFYCPTQDIVAFDRRLLFPTLEKTFGPFLIAMVLAHEWGHAIQHRTALPSSRTIVIETQADCYAGAWTKNALMGGAPHFQITRIDLDRGLAGYLQFRDPVGADPNNRAAHGSGFDRISAFQEGFEQGPKHCAAFGDTRTFTEIPFNNQQDAAQGGNLPYDQAISSGTQDIAQFWATSFPKLFGRPWQPVAKLDGYDGNGPRSSCDGKPVGEVMYCPTDDTIHFDKTVGLLAVYNQNGPADFAPITLLGVAYGMAVRKRLGMTIAGENALLGSICLQGGYSRDVFDHVRPNAIIQLSPGDLDKAIQALLNFAGKSGFFDATGTVGFDRVAAFRHGFDNIKSCQS